MECQTTSYVYLPSIPGQVFRYVVSLKKTVTQDVLTALIQSKAVYMCEKEVERDREIERRDRGQTLKRYIS